MEHTMWEIEDQNYEAGFKVICGVDEAGRGPLAGPVYAAAVILPPHAQIPGLNDSKKLSDKRRRELFPVICNQAIAYGIGIAAAALVLLLWQGSIYLFAGVIAPYMMPALMGEISVLGGIFLMSSGLGILQLRDCKTLNMLPALIVPPIFYALMAAIK